MIAPSRSLPGADSQTAAESARLERSGAFASRFPGGLDVFFFCVYSITGNSPRVLPSGKPGAVQWAIAPDKLVREDLIVARWDDVLRLVATIKLKEATASDIFRRLNSYAEQHEHYRALKTFGHVIKTLFVLRYVDEVDLRQAIEQRLSRIELAHRFTRDVAVGNPREFEQTDKESRRSPRAATGSSRTPSSAGAACTSSTG
jgi:uncharacterized protein YlbG (UPF0298 family)